MNELEKIARIQRSLLNDAGKLNFLGKIGVAILIIILANILVLICRRLINRVMVAQEKKDKRTRVTLLKVAMSIVRWFVFFVAALQILSIFGVNTNSILATAGIGGLAIGLGAQSLIQDVIAGTFILVEDKFNVGDHVKFNNTQEGIVQEVGVKSSIIEDFLGGIHIINNGSITMVSNYSKKPQLTNIRIPVSYDTGEEEFQKVLERTFERLIEERKEVLTTDPFFLGYLELQPSYKIAIVRFGAIAGEQWDCQYCYDAILLEEMRKAGIDFAKYNE